MNIDKILELMTLEEKAALVSGTDFWYTNPIPRLGVPSICTSDGPHGLRRQKGRGDNGIGRSEPATAFPTAAALASSWNPDNMRRMGEALARECRFYGVHALLGPGLNIKRDPLCGRNFEYFSEDPLLAGVMGAAQVEGLQGLGVGAVIKHFALNNSENHRFMGNSVASENTIRNLYLKPFEYVVKHARPAAVMCAYNRLNGVFCSENEWLLTDVLRNEWGFDGVVMSDWGAVKDRVAGIHAGLDLEMPGDASYCRRAILDAAKNGTLDLAKLDDACRNILKWIDRAIKPNGARQDADKNAPPVDWAAHHALAAELAADSAVLLKNNGVLPLTGSEKLCAVGELFENMRYQGAGSSMINPSMLTSPKDAFAARGVELHSLEECDTVLVFAGLTDFYETEGRDRDDMHLPQDQLDLLATLSSSGKRIVVILFGGSPVELPFYDKVDAILNMYLPGQNGGTAVCDLVFGRVNPSGRLAETWPLRYEDCPCSASFGKRVNEVYSEGLEVGYRYYNKHSVPVRFPFGFGLSYTEFEQSNWEREGDAYCQTVKNVGDRFGGFVSMLFLDGELRGFEKVYLSPGEERLVRIKPHIEPQTRYSDEYTVPDEPPRYPITTESRLSDLKQTRTGRIIFRIVNAYSSRMARKAKRMPEGAERENLLKVSFFITSVLETNSLRCMSMTAGRLLPYNVARGIAELANGRIFKGLACMLRRIRVPKLPKKQRRSR